MCATGRFYIFKMEYGHEIAKKVILGLPPQKDSSRRHFRIKCLRSQKVIKWLFGLVDFGDRRKVFRNFNTFFEKTFTKSVQKFNNFLGGNFLGIPMGKLLIVKPERSAISLYAHCATHENDKRSLSTIRGGLRRDCHGLHTAYH